MKRLWVFILMITLVLSACSTPAMIGATDTNAPKTDPTGPKVLTIYAAASLTDAFNEIGKAFETLHPGVVVKFNFGGSQTLRTQIEQGAKADVFAPANVKEMDTLVKKTYIAADAPRVFLTNQLVVIMPAQNPAGLTRLEDLAKSRLKLVLAAKEVPVGSYSQQVLDQLDRSFGNGYKDHVLANVVSYENDVRQVVTKVQLGEADAGIVYASDAVASPELKKIDIPASSNVVAQYPIAVLTQSDNPEAAQAFIAYVLSPDGQSILKKWGFSPVK